MALTTVGIDLGGSHVTVLVARMSQEGQYEVIQSAVQAITDRAVSKVVDVIVECTRRTIESSGIPISDMTAVGIAIPGNVDPMRNETRYLPNFGWLDPVPLGQTLSERLDQLPVVMRNDGRCAAIAESKYGSGRNSKVFAMLTLGTGIGGALVIDGKLFDGSSFDAGDFGHHVIRSGEDAFQCICGKRGCFEFHASADGLVRQFNKQAGSKGVTTAIQVLELLRGDESPATETAKRAFEIYLDDLSSGLANLVTFYNPDTIALGGGLAQAPEIFQGLVERVDAKTLPATRGKVKIVPAVLGVDSGAVGAALLAYNTTPSRI